MFHRTALPTSIRLQRHSLHSRHRDCCSTELASQHLLSPWPTATCLLGIFFVVDPSDTCSTEQAYRDSFSRHSLHSRHQRPPFHRTRLPSPCQSDVTLFQHNRSTNWQDNLHLWPPSTKWAPTVSCDLGHAGSRNCSIPHTMCTPDRYICTLNQQ